MLPTQAADTLLSRDEVAEAIRSLPDPAWIRLRKIAATLCRARPSDADDLLQEAFVRALDGSRQCPHDVDIVRFLAGVMTSIASDFAKALSRHPELRAIPLHDEDGLLVVDPPDKRPSPEQVAISAEVCTRMVYRLLGLFEDDPVAQVTVEGMLDGWEGDELRTLTDLDEVAFASKRRFIRRRIDKTFPNGWKP